MRALEGDTGQSCEAVITRLEYDGGAIVDVNVYVTNAKVDLRSGESAFLDREPAGWKLTAVGCEPELGGPRDVPFDCQAES